MEGKLGHKKFEFDKWNDGGERKSVKPYSCGYAGCAIGECPIVFPKNWVFGVESDPVLRQNKEEMFANPKREAMVFFGLSDNEATHLFIPDSQNTLLYGGRLLGENAKRQSVAKNILAFLEVKRGKK